MSDNFDAWFDELFKDFDRRFNDIFGFLDSSEIARAEASAYNEHLSFLKTIPEALKAGEMRAEDAAKFLASTREKVANSGLAQETKNRFEQFALSLEEVIKYFALGEDERLAGGRLAGFIANALKGTRASFRLLPTENGFDVWFINQSGLPFENAYNLIEAIKSQVQKQAAEEKVHVSSSGQGIMTMEHAEAFRSPDDNIIRINKMAVYEISLLETEGDAIGRAFA